MALVSRYETYQQLGKGSSGTVYRALDVVLGQEVALRILNADSRFSSRLLDLFFTDEQAASEWLHPNVATVHDLGQSSAGAFMATELLTGATMRSHIGKPSNFSFVQKLDLLVQACNGLAHAHTKGVIHAAITPKSFFITENRQLKILDLGIRHVSRSLPEAGTLDSVTYLAPEQVWEQSSSMRSDLFSAAVVFYGFLVDIHPFANAIVPRSSSEGSAETILAPKESLPESLEKLLKRALSRSPEQRPQSAFELAAAIRAVEREISSPVMHRFGDRPRFMDRPHASPDKSWEGHSNVKAFLELLRQFEDNLSQKNWSEAGRCLQGMKFLNAIPNEEFIPPILDSEKRLNSARQSAIQEINQSVEPVRGAAVVTSKRMWARLSGVPPIRSSVFGTVVVAVLLLVAAFVANKLKQGNPRAVLAQAQVNAPETIVFASWYGSSRSLATLKKGTWVDILERIPTQHDGFVLASQSFPNKQRIPPGYVQVSDLGMWRSDDAEVAWSLLASSKPSPNSDADNIQKYLLDLQSYRAKFPKSSQARSVDSETDHWREILAYLLKRQAGSANSQPTTLVDKTSLPPTPAIVGSPDTVARRDQEKLKSLLDRMPSLWEEGDLEGIMELSRQATVLDQKNREITKWRSKARIALQKLGTPGASNHPGSQPQR